MRLAASSLPVVGVGVILTDFFLPPSLVVSDIDLMGWGTAAVFCVWVLLSLHTQQQQQQQDSITSNTSAELVDELEFREIVGYLEFKIFTYMSFF